MLAQLQEAEERDGLITQKRYAKLKVPRRKRGIITLSGFANMEKTSVGHQPPTSNKNSQDSRYTKQDNHPYHPSNNEKHIIVNINIIIFPQHHPPRHPYL
jgi:hypothetical protein